jgi:hypothetical protein
MSGRAAGKTIPAQASLSSAEDNGWGEEASYCPGQWRTPMARPSFLIYHAKKPAIDVSKSWTENRILIYQNLS